MKGIHAFVPSSSQNRNRKHTTTRYRANDVKNGIKLHPSQRQQQLMMMIPPQSTSGSEFQFEVPSSLPDFPSIIFGSDLEPTQTFEPQVNTPALIAFAIIAVIFSLLQFRINSVSDAAKRRQEALTVLRQVKAEQLDSSSFGSNTTQERSNNDSNDQSKVSEDSETNDIMNEKVRNAIKAYENALKEELNLRTILPGIRIAAPNDATRREEDIAAAKQFLDWDILLDEEDASVGSGSNSNTDGKEEKMDSDETRKMRLLMQSRRRFDGKDNQNISTSTSSSSENEGTTGTMSNGAKAILLTVALSQIALLFLLSLDPMSANNVFTDIAGSPPDNIPLTSWSN